jgi:hypothetical protein
MPQTYEKRPVDLSKAPKSEAAAKRFLKLLGCSPPLRNRVNRQVFQPAVFLSIAVVLIVAALWLGPMLSQRTPKLETYTLIVAIGNLIIAMSILLGISKWHTSLEQDAMKQYESEIAEGSKAEADESVIEMMKHLYRPVSQSIPRDYKKSHYVYVQLDNLEYALERYMQGIASAYTTARAVMTFASRCGSPEFRDRARQQVVDASYSPVVLEVVDSIVGKQLAS